MLCALDTTCLGILSTRLARGSVLGVSHARWVPLRCAIAAVSDKTGTLVTRASAVLAAGARGLVDVRGETGWSGSWGRVEWAVLLRGGGSGVRFVGEHAADGGEGFLDCPKNAGDRGAGVGVVAGLGCVFAGSSWLTAVGGDGSRESGMCRGPASGLFCQ